MTRLFCAGSTIRKISVIWRAKVELMVFLNTGPGHEVTEVEVEAAGLAEGRPHGEDEGFSERLLLRDHANSQLSEGVSSAWPKLIAKLS